MIKLEPEELEIIKTILRKYVSNCEIRAFGSRLTANPKKYADLDLAIVCQQKIPRETLIAIQDEFAESELTFRIDLLDWQRITPEFQKVINQHYECLNFVK